MNIAELEKRVELLKCEYQKSQSSLSLLKEQLEKSEIHHHVIGGHLNEANFIYNQFVIPPLDKPECLNEAECLSGDSPDGQE